MRILVIGGAGYIGSHVVLTLLEQGHEVTVYDNLSSGTRNNLFPDAEFVEGDILETHQLLQTMKQGFDGLVHLAAFKAAGESMVKPEKYSVNNLTGTIYILNCACEADIKMFVFSSSAAVYGNPQYIPLDEKHPTEPENYYGFTKLEIERLLNWYDKLKGIKFAALRYFNAAGYDPEGRISGLERNPANLLPVVMETAAGMRKELKIFGDDYPTKDGTGVRDYIHVNDLADGHVQAFNYLQDKKVSLTVNLGSEEGLSVREILETARTVTGRPIPAQVTRRRPGDPPKLIASSNLAEKVLNWRPRFSDKETLVASTWQAYQNQDGKP